MSDTDANNKNPLSPWDEPLPEVDNQQVQQPTVIGDLDFNRGAAATSGPEANTEKVTTLKVPENVEEKVGAKVEVNQVTANQGANKAVETNPAVSPGVNINRQTSSNKEPVSDDEFWRNAYSNNPPTAAVSQTTSANSEAPIAANSVLPKTPDSASAQVVPQTGANSTSSSDQQLQSTAAPNPTNSPAQGDNHLYQPIPESTTAPAPVQQTNTSSPNQGQNILAKSKFSLKQIIPMAIGGLFLLFAVGVYLTEAGSISFGLEKFYGLLHLEKIWGGLPVNSQSALALSAQVMGEQTSYQVSGQGKVIINRGVKSDIISPVVAISTLPITVNNSELSQGLKAVLAAYETDDEFDEDVDSYFEDFSTNQNNSSTSKKTNPKPQVEEFEVDVKAAFDNKVSGADIKLKSTSKGESSLNLVYSQGKIYLKTSPDIVFNPYVTAGNWLSYDLKSFKQANPSSQFWSVSTGSSDFSITGKRQGNEVVDGVRCFHYSAVINIGNAFSSFGLTQNSLSELEAEYWLGVRDHRIRQLKIKAIPLTSAISRIDLTLNFSGYDSKNSGFVVPTTSTPSVIGLANNNANESVQSNSQSGDQTSEQTPTNRDRKRKSDLADIARALENYQLVTGNYPQSNGLEKISAFSGTIYNTLVPNYLSRVPLDPQDPTYYYGYESDGKSYTLSAVLENQTDPEGRKVGSKNLYFLRGQN